MSNNAVTSFRVVGSPPKFRFNADDCFGRQKDSSLRLAHLVIHSDIRGLIDSTSTVINAFFFPCSSIVKQGSETLSVPSKYNLPLPPGYPREYRLVDFYSIRTNTVSIANLTRTSIVSVRSTHKPTVSLSSAVSFCCRARGTSNTSSKYRYVTASRNQIRGMSFFDSIVEVAQKCSSSCFPRIEFSSAENCVGNGRPS